MKRYRKTLFSLLKLVLGIILLILSIQGIDWIKVRDCLFQANVFWFALALVFVLSGLGLKIIRWKWILASLKIQTGYLKLASAFFLGQTANIVLPVRGGEVVRVGVGLSGVESFGPVVISILLEKYLDLILFVVSSLAVSANLPEETSSRFSSFLFPACVLATCLVILVLLKGDSLWRFLRRWIRSDKTAVEHFLQRVDKAVNSLVYLRRPEFLISQLGITVVIWGVMLFTNLFLLKALNLPFDFRIGGLVLTLVYAGVLPALMPGNIGPFYYFARIALEQFNLDAMASLAFAILLHAMVTLPPLIISVVFLLFDKSILTRLKTRWK